MKKYFLILAVAALTGCFGGGEPSNNNNGGGSDNNAGGSKKHQTAQSDDIIRRADGSVIKKGGYKSAPPKDNTPQYKASIDASKLPAKVDLRPYMTAVENQSTLGSCTANAAAGAYEYLKKWHQQENFDLSRLFLYYNTRALMGLENEDSGGNFYDVMEAMAEYGVCSEKSWPYDIKKYRQKPPSQCYEEAKQNVISKYEQVELDLTAWKSVLAEGYPIVFGIGTSSAFDNPRNGFIPTPKSGEADQGGHAMCCVGYSDPDKVFIVRNSWGHQWGDKGYCYIPYSYMLNPEFNTGDCFVIYSIDGGVNTDKIEEEAWSDDNQSVFVDMENEFSNMSDETWYAMCDELGDYDIVYRLGVLYCVATCGDGDMAPAEQKAALGKLKRILQLFGLNYSPKKVFENCLDIVLEKDDWLEWVQESIEILSKYLSEGARATIAADMLEVCSADGEASDDERDLILGLVSDWINNDLIEAYYNDYFDEDDYEDYDYYDEEEDYDYDYDDEDYYEES
ncbi:MAG: hypothetical protein IKO99_10765 [Bacteroidales bacterium]|nr:hypothetical protein [Bacteroidales bacterium]